MKVYIIYFEYLKDVKRKNSGFKSAKKGDIRFHKCYATKSAAECELNLMNSCVYESECVYKIKEVELKEGE